MCHLCACGSSPAVLCHGPNILVLFLVCFYYYYYFFPEDEEMTEQDRCLMGFGFFLGLFNYFFLS